MNSAPFSFDSLKDKPNTQLSSYFRSEAVKFESMETISDKDLLSIFRESLKFFTRKLDNFLLNDLVYLIDKCWHKNPKILWEQNSDQIIKISKENFNGMIIVTSISAFTLDMNDSEIDPKSKTFFEEFVHDSFNEINENCDNIDNQECDSFLIFNQNLTKKEFFHFLFELVQSIPYSNDYLSKYLPYLFDRLPSTNIYTLYSFFINNSMIEILPRSIFLNENFLEFASLSDSFILLNEMTKEEFLVTYSWYFLKIYYNEYNNSELSYSFLKQLSRTDSEEVIDYMNKIYEDKPRIQKVLEFASECEFSAEIILNLRQYRFRLPESVSKKFASLDDNEYLATISSNPLLYMDRTELEPILLSSENPLVYKNLFRNYVLSDPIFKDLNFWAHAIPFISKINEPSANSLFVQVDTTNVSERISNLLLLNFPQNMNHIFFNFAKNILEQDHDFESFSKSNETLILLSQIDCYQPLDFWKLFVLVDPIISTINSNFEGHLALTLGLAYLSIYQYKIHASPPDPKIKVFNISQQNEESVKELHSLAENKPDWKTDLSSLSEPALSVAAAANLFSSVILNRFTEFKIEGLTDDVFLPFITIVINNLSYANRDFNFNDNFMRYNRLQQDSPLNNFLNKSNFSDKMIQNLRLINFENPNNNFIEMLLNIFIKFIRNINIINNFGEPLLKILKIFSENLPFYFDINSPNAKLMAQFFGRISKDFLDHGKNSKKIKSAITIQMQNYIIRLLIAFPCEYSSDIFDDQVIKKVIQEEKGKNDNNINIIKFLMHDPTKIHTKNKLVFNSDEIMIMINQTIESKDFYSLRKVISYSESLSIDEFVPLLERDIPIDVKINILNKFIPCDGGNAINHHTYTKARKIITFDTLISIFKETKNIEIFGKKLFQICFFFLLESPLAVDYFMVLFEKYYDYSPLNEIRFNGKLGTDEFKKAFKKTFTILQNERNSCIIKNPFSPKLEQPTDFSLKFINMLIDDFMDQPTWQILIILLFLANNLPFLFLFIDRIESIFKSLFNLFNIFEKYQEIPFSQKLSHLRKNKQPTRTNNAHRVPFPMAPSDNDDDDDEEELNNNDQLENNEENNEADIEFSNMKNLFKAAYTGVHFLASLVSIPKIMDQFYHWSLDNFTSFSPGQVVSFISILIPTINRETTRHVAVSYLIRYDWILLFTEYYKNIERPINKFSRYILAKLLQITYDSFIKYIHLLDRESVATLDELTKLDNPFEVSLDHRTQISPILIPWFSIRKSEFKVNSVRNVLGISAPNPDRPNNFFPNNLFGNRFNLAPNRLNRPNLYARAFNAIDGRPNGEQLNPTTHNNDGIDNANEENNNNNNNNNNDNINYNEGNSNENPESTNNANSEVQNENRENTNNANSEIQNENAESAIDHPPASQQPNQPGERNTDQNINRAHQPIINRQIQVGRYPRIPRNPPGIGRPNQFHSFQDLLLNNIRQLNRERAEDIVSHYSFWTIFNFTDDEVEYMKNVSRTSMNKEIEHQKDSIIPVSTLLSLSSESIEQVDLSSFSNIKNDFIFYQLDKVCQAAILRNEITVPLKLSASMQRYMIKQPQWMTAFISEPPQVIFAPQHYSALQNVLVNLKQIEDSNENESEDAKQFYDNFISEFNTKSQIIIDVFLSPKYDLSYFTYLDFRNTIVYKNTIFKSMTGILYWLAMENEETLKLILEKISESFSAMDPYIIEQLLQILVSLAKLYRSNINRYFSLSLFQQMARIVGSPEIRTQSAIIETAARLMVDLSSIFYENKDNENLSKIYSEIESSTLQIFLILLNSPNIQTVNRAMKLSSNLGDQIKKQLEPTILSRFDSIFAKISDDTKDDDEISSIINSDCISVFLIEFMKLITADKDKLLLILEKALKIKDKNVRLISNLIDYLCPKRLRQIPTKRRIETNTGNSDNNDNDENANNNGKREYNGKQILIPISYYDKNPKFWQIIFDNLAWFQDYVANHQASLDTTFKFLKSYMELLTFKQKCYYFRRDQYRSKIIQKKFKLNVRRGEILKDSFIKLRPSASNSRENILSDFQIKFEGELGYDMGGLTRDWFTSLVKELFNPNYALFTLSENRLSYQPNPSSSINSNHLEYFEFAGLIIARAIIGGICVDAHLTSSFIKQILGVELSLQDLQDVDKRVYDSLIWTLENKIDDQNLGLRFTSGYKDIDTTKIVELKENGENIPVTDENKKEYVKLLYQHIMKGQIEEQIQAFLNGFYSLIPRKEITLFTPSELDLLICGVPEIDVEDLKRNCDFTTPYSRNHPAVTMFFDVISKWGHEDLAKLLLFITGSSQVPIGGFKMMKESRMPIIIAPGGEEPRLPQSHTCMNTLDLPIYKDEKNLEEKLLLSISECKSFGFN